MNRQQNEDSKEDGSGGALGRFVEHRTLVFGGSGLIGKSLLSKIECESPSSGECDIRSFDAVNDFIKDYRPTVVVNLAGEADPAKCNTDNSYHLNVNAVTNICYALAKYCKGATLFQAGSINQILKPHDFYSVQKTKAAKIVDSYSGVLGVINARLCTVEAGYRQGFIVSDMVKMLQRYKKGGDFFYLNDIGAQKWECGVSAITSSIAKSIKDGLEGTFYFGSIISFTIEDIFCEICRQMNINAYKVGYIWTDADSGRVIMQTKRQSVGNLLPNFGPPAYKGEMETDLKSIINTIIVSS